MVKADFSAQVQNGEMSTVILHLYLHLNIKFSGKFLCRRYNHTSPKSGYTAERQLQQTHTQQTKGERNT